MQATEKLLLLKDPPSTTKCDVAGYKSHEVNVATDNTAGCKSHEGDNFNITGENTAVSKNQVDCMVANNDVCKEKAGETEKRRGRKKKLSASISKKKFNLAVQQGKQDSKQDKVELVSVSQWKSARIMSEGIIKDVDKIAELEIEPNDKQKNVL